LLILTGTYTTNYTIWTTLYAYNNVE